MTEIRILLLLLLCSGFSLQAHAAMHTYNFNGTMYDHDSSLPIAAGDMFEGSFVFDSEPVQSGFVPNYFLNFEITISTTSGPLTFTAAPADAHLTDAAIDEFQISGSPSGLYSMSLLLEGGTTGYDPSSFTNPLNFGGFSSRTIIQLWETASLYSRGNITSLTRAVTEPTPSANRAALIDNGDGTITDTYTGLMWMQNVNESGPPQTWDQANTWVAQLNLNANNFGGHSDWRLPTGDSTQYLHGELWTLFIAYKAFLNDGEPFLGITGLDVVWTATEDPADPSKAMVSIWMFDGNLVSQPKSAQSHVWAVRTVPGGAPGLSVDVWLKDWWNDSSYEPSSRSGQSVDIFIDNDRDGRIDLPRQWDHPISAVTYNTVRAYLRNKTNAWVVARAGLYRWNCETRSSISNTDRYDTGNFRKIMLPPLGRRLMEFPDVRLSNKANDGDKFCLGVRVIHNGDTGPDLPSEPRDSNNLASAEVYFIATREGQIASQSGWYQNSWLIALLVAIIAMPLEWYLARRYYRRQYG